MAQSVILVYTLSERNLKLHVIGNQKQTGLYFSKRNFCASQKVKLNAVLIEYCPNSLHKNVQTMYCKFDVIERFGDLKKNAFEGYQMKWHVTPTFR